MHPLTLIHDLAGDGYVCSVALIILVAWALGTSSKSRLLYCTLAFSLVGPIAMDAVFNYFYAPRQLLFAAPALVLLAAQGFERLRADSHGLIAWSLLAAFFIAACVTNYRQAVIPRDSLARTADAIAARLRPGVCVMAVPKGHIAFYSFFHPELQGRACPDHSSTREIVAAVSVYTTPAERRAFEDSISASYEPRETVRVGQSEITTYVPR
jgi:hypothetical protein